MLPFLVCSEHHRRVRRHQTASGISHEIDPAALTPRLFQVELNNIRKRARLDDIDFQCSHPCRSKSRLQQGPNLQVGDCSAHGVVLVGVPGEAYNGPLSLHSLMHQIAYAALGKPQEWALFTVLGSFAFHDAGFRDIGGLCISFRRSMC